MPYAFSERRIFSFPYFRRNSRTRKSCRGLYALFGDSGRHAIFLGCAHRLGIGAADQFRLQLLL